MSTSTKRTTSAECIIKCSFPEINRKTPMLLITQKALTTSQSLELTNLLQGFACGVSLHVKWKSFRKLKNELVCSRFYSSLFYRSHTQLFGKCQDSNRVNLYMPPHLLQCIYNVLVSRQSSSSFMILGILAIVVTFPSCCSETPLRLLCTICAENLKWTWVPWSTKCLCNDLSGQMCSIAKMSAYIKIRFLLLKFWSERIDANNNKGNKR